NKKLEELEEVTSKIRIYTSRMDEEKLKKWRERENRVLTLISELDNRFDTLLKGDCTICYSKIVSPVMEPSCQNIFCAKCLLKWLQQSDTCPMCRQQVDTQNLVYITAECEEHKVDTPPTKE
ncbi:unnamed protein product, partial [marine sediment metagenome]